MEGSQPLSPATMLENTPRAPEDQEWGKLVEFLNANLRPNSAWSIADEYPTAIHRDNRHNSRIIVENGQIVSHAVVRHLLIKTPIGVFKVAGIGSVVTSSDHRGQGHSTRIMESCLENARAAGCDFAILWTDLFDFYRRMGFELAGGEVTALIDRNFHINQEFRFNDSNRIAPDAILRVYNQHTVSSHRTIEDIRASLAIPNSRVSTAWDATGKLAAYAIEGKGADLDGYVHEWGGSASAVLALLNHMRAKAGRDLRVIAPAHARNLISKIGEAGCHTHAGHLGMIKLLKTDSLFSKIKRHARALGISDLVLEEREGKFYFGRGNHIYSTPSEVDLLRLMFGPEKPSDLHQFEPSTQSAFDRLLPVPLWIWGWDSV